MDEKSKKLRKSKNKLSNRVDFEVVDMLNEFRNEIDNVKEIAADNDGDNGNDDNDIEDY